MVHQVGFFGVESDFYANYAPQTTGLLEGRPYTYSHNPPGYVLLLAPGTWLLGDAFTAAKILTALAAAGFAGVGYLLLRSTFGSAIALASTVLCALALVPHAYLAATDLVCAFFIVLALWLTLRTPSLRWRQCFGVGLLAGVAYLIRSPAIFLVGGIALCLLFLECEPNTLRNRAKLLVAFLGGALLIAAPWLVYNWSVNGSPFAGSAHLQVAAHFHHPTGDRFRTSLIEMAPRFDSLSQVFLHDPGEVSKTYLKDVLGRNPWQIATRCLQFPAFLFAGAGLLLLLGDLCRKRIALLGVYGLGYLLLGLVGFYTRYYLFLFPLLFMGAAYFAFDPRVSAKLGSATRLGRGASWALIGVIALFLGSATFSTVRTQLASEPRHLLELAQFLRERSSAGDRMIVRTPHLASLAGFEYRFLVEREPELFLRRAREMGARYLVYSERGARQWPALEVLREPERVPDDFELIYRHEPTHTLVYELPGP